MSSEYKLKTILVFTINRDVIVDHILSYFDVFYLRELDKLLIFDCLFVLSHDHPLEFKKYH